VDSDHHLDRRRLLGAAAVAVGATAVGASAVTGPPAAAAERAATAFGPLRRIAAGELDVGYVEQGPAHGRPVVLLHGFPYDIHSYVDVAPLLARRGYRVIVPYLRGHGTTTFRSRTDPRSAEQVAFALDVLALMDALGIGRAVLAGYDWGSRTADIIAALWPERCRALVSVSGYLVTNLAVNREPLPPAAENAWWYQYYFATERGALGLARYRHDLGRFIWSFNSPTWRFTPAVYDRTAASFENPDWVTVILGNYRWRLGLAASDPRYADAEARLQQAPVIGVPTITIDGAHDPFTPAGNGAGYRARFSGRYEHRSLDVGHNVPQEAPAAFARAVLDADRL